MMNILIAGSSGLIGEALVKSLKEKGHLVVRLVRPGSSIKDEHIVWQPAGGADSTGEIDAMDFTGGEGFDAVINLCGEPVAAKRWTKKQKKRILTSRVDTTSLLASMMADSEAGSLFSVPPKIFINASAIGIYGDKGDFLRQVCEQWEAAAQPAVAAGIPTYFLRIGLVVSANARFLKLQKPLFKLGLGGWIGSPGSWLSWISLKDAVGAVSFILENPSSFENSSSFEETKETKKLGTPINLTAPEPATAKEFAKALGGAMNRPVFLRIPKLGPQMLMGRELAKTLLQSAKVEPEQLLSAGYEFKHPNIEGAFQDIFR